jgi:hypothetical protein
MTRSASKRRSRSTTSARSPGTPSPVSLRWTSSGATSSPTPKGSERSNYTLNVQQGTGKTGVFETIVNAAGDILWRGNETMSTATTSGLDDVDTYIARSYCTEETPQWSVQRYSGAWWVDRGVYCTSLEPIGPFDTMEDADAAYLEMLDREGESE